jgi:hypothetical protein
LAIIFSVSALNTAAQSNILRRFMLKKQVIPPAYPSYLDTIKPVDVGASGTRAGPGYPLQFLSPPEAGLRDFRFYPLRFAHKVV